MPSSRRIACLAAAAGLAVFPAGMARAQGAREVGVRLIVVHASPSPGPIDPGAERLHRRLQKEFRYESLHVMQRQRLRLPMREMRKVELPTGHSLQVRALELDREGLLMSFEMQGRLNTRVLLRPKKQVVIGAERYRDGKLIIAIERDY